MSKLLYIEASPRKDRSLSIAVANDFLGAYGAENPGDDVDTLDLWDTTLPPFDGNMLEAKYAVLHGQEHTPEQACAWAGVTETFERFAAAEKFLFSLPMWNFGIPYRLKQYIDVITQPGLAFSYSPEKGYDGLVTGRPAVLIYTRGGEYPIGTAAEPFDMQKSYMELWLGFIGFTDIRSIVIEPTLDPSRVKDARLSAAHIARTMGASFGHKLVLH